LQECLVDDPGLDPLDPDLALALERGFRLWKERALSAAHTTLVAALREAERRGSVAGQLGALQLLGNVAFERGDTHASRSYHQRALAICRRHRLGVGVASSLHNLGLVAAAEGDGGRARALIAEAANLYQQIGTPAAAERARQSLRQLATGEPPRG
jgi:tetratricopeptide (TPR) repeat protein